MTAERLLRAITPARQERAGEPIPPQYGTNHAAAETWMDETGFGGSVPPETLPERPWEDWPEAAAVWDADVQAISHAFRRDARRYDE